MQHKSVYEQLLNPQANNSSTLDNRGLNIYHRDQSIIQCRNMSHQNVMEYQSDYDKPTKIKFR